MITLVKNLSSPLLSFIAITLATSFMATFLGVKTKEMTQDNWIVGSMMSCMYAGIVFGAFRLESLVSHIGHVRSFCIFSSLLAITSLLHSLHFSPIFWMILRFISGACLAGLYIVIESWLLKNSTPQNRGTILALYTTTLYFSQSIGQLFLYLDHETAVVSFTLVAILCSLSILPISLTKKSSPKIKKFTFLKVSTLYHLSPTSFIGCLLSGMIVGAIYALIHSYIRDIGRINDLALVMITIILGGAFLQYPIGLCTNKLDKKKVLLSVLSINIVSCFLIIALEQNVCLTYLDYLSFFFFGGSSFSLYSLNINIACDHIKPENFLSAIGGLLLFYGIGAILGPLIAPFVMYFLGPLGLFIYFIITALILGCFSIYRSFIRPSKPLDQQSPYTATVQTTPTAHTLFSYKNNI